VIGAVFALLVLLAAVNYLSDRRAVSKEREENHDH
jgi:hypothetical protein